jgi:predicted O-linked N-acetylglucosamine transferase (SPINDLY family)
MDKAYDLFSLGKYSEAITLYEEAIALEPENKSNYWFLSLCLLLQDNPEEALMTWWLTLDEDSQYAESFTEFLRQFATELGHKLDRYDLSINILKAAINLEPENISLLRDLARFYRFRSQYDDCIDIAQKYLAIAQELPDQIFANHLILHSLMTAGCQWQEIFTKGDQQISLLRSLIDRKNTPIDLVFTNRLFCSTFFLAYLKDDPVNNRRLQNSLAEVCQNNVRLYRKDEIDKYQAPKPSKKLKIGYLSHCLGKNSVGWLSRWIFEHHDHEKFSIHTYFVLDKSNNVDSVKDAIAENSDKSHRLGYDPLEITQKILEDEIDILVDLDSITIDVTCEVMAMKPAPIQVTWLGLDASGIPAIDYFIADPYVLPENAQDYYSEKIWRLPNTYIAVDGFEVLFPTLHRDQIDIPEDAIVYLSAQTGYKRHPDMVRLQVRIIKSVPNSFLLIKGLSDQDGIQNFFKEIAQEEGISGDRLRFLPMVGGEAEHRANLDIADVILDTYPYNGATTTMETLWMCIPLVTRVGQQFAARNSYTMMMNAGITEGIAWTDTEYVEWGIKLGMHENLRKQVFWKLKESRKTSPLWNAKQFTKDMENAYQQMWKIYLEENSYKVRF